MSALCMTDKQIRGYIRQVKEGWVLDFQGRALLIGGTTFSKQESLVNAKRVVRNAMRASELPVALSRG